MDKKIVIYIKFGFSYYSLPIASSAIDATLHKANVMIITMIADTVPHMEQRYV